MSNIEKYTPENIEDLEKERERVLRESEAEADLRNEGLSPRKKTRRGKETAETVMHGEAITDDQDRDYQKMQEMKVLHDYPGSIEEMERVVSQGGRYSMDIYLFAHRSAKNAKEKTKVYKLYRKQKVNPFEGGSRAKTLEMVMLQREAEKNQ